MRRLLIAVISAVFLFGIITVASADEAGKLGYVDLARVFDRYQKTIDYDKELEKKGDRKQSEREKKISELKQLKEELDLLSEKGREKKQGKIDEKVKELQNFDLAARTDLKKERDDVVREVLGEIDKVIQEYARSEDYSLIFNNRVLLYGDKQLNLTDEILKILNKKYKK